MFWLSWEVFWNDENDVLGLKTNICQSLICIVSDKLALGCIGFIFIWDLLFGHFILNINATFSILA